MWRAHGTGCDARQDVSSPLGCPERSASATRACRAGASSMQRVECRAFLRHEVDSNRPLVRVCRVMPVNQSQRLSHADVQPWVVFRPVPGEAALLQGVLCLAALEQRRAGACVARLVKHPGLDWMRCSRQSEFFRPALANSASRPGCPL